MGSPPHTRGKGTDRQIFEEHSGITPAHAGKSSCFFFKFIPIWDHPRTRGEKNLCGVRANTLRGSPPHARGKEQGNVSVQFRIGITPAHAGKSHRTCRCTRCNQDHPRTRGEKLFTGLLLTIFMGSPPHTRGKVSVRPAPTGRAGITPAHAGKS